MSNESGGRRTRGAAVIEFALLILVLMLLALGVFDFGLAIEQGVAVSAAAHAGAIYGVAEGHANDTAGMQTAARNAAKSIAGLMSVSAATWCVCSAGSTTNVSCTSLCSSNPPVQYVKVNTGISVPVLISFPGVPNSFTMAGSATMRAR